MKSHPSLKGPRLSSPREIIKKGSKSFALASLFLPKSQRADVYTLYAWFRHCDDVIDSSNAQLEDLKRLKTETFQQDPTSNFFELQNLISEKNLTTKYFNEFFEGLQMDLENKGYDTISQLELYCYRVAGVVGLIMCPLIGVRQTEAFSHACSLGLGMQLTNICRDVVEDAQNGRIYLPRQMLIPNATCEELIQSPEKAYPTVLQLLELADSYYKRGNLGLKYLPFRVAIAIGSASCIYRQIGVKIRRLGPESMKKRVYVTTFEKIKCVGLGIMWALRSRL